jgi:hypothetical protein
MELMQESTPYTDSVLGIYAKLRKAIIISIMPVRPFGQSSLDPRGRIRLLLDEFSRNSIFDDFFGNLPRKFRFDQNMTRITGTLHLRSIFMMSR